MQPVITEMDPEECVEEQYKVLGSFQMPAIPPPELCSMEVPYHTAGFWVLLSSSHCQPQRCAPT